MAQRGRPKSEEPVEQLVNFVRTFKEPNGVEILWYYDLSRTKKGPVEVEIKYPKVYKTFDEEQESLPITQRKFYNPSNGNYVGYQRAKVLGIL